MMFDIPPRPAWHRRAACRGMDPSLFFPERGEPTKDAKDTCAICPVRAQCEEQAMTTFERYGIWAGYTSRQLQSKRARGTIRRAS